MPAARGFFLHHCSSLHGFVSKPCFARGTLQTAYKLAQEINKSGNHLESSADAASYFSFGVGREEGGEGSSTMPSGVT